jgi:putative transposase
MKHYRRGARTVFEIETHLVWTTKYRKPVMRGEAGLRVRELIRQICAANEVTTPRGHVARDHVHLLVPIPPQVPISRLVMYLKGKTSHELLAEFSHMRKAFWGRHVWARGYFCCSRGNVTDEVIAAYIAGQPDTPDAEFRVEGEDQPA